MLSRYQDKHEVFQVLMDCLLLEFTQEPVSPQQREACIAKILMPDAEKR